MTVSDPVKRVEERIEEFIKNIQVRNTKVQTAKKQGSWGWVVAVVLALVSLVGIGVAMYLASRRAKELAKAKTQLEQAKIIQEQAAHEAKREPLQHIRTAALVELKKAERALEERQEALAQAEIQHTEREVKLRKLRAWEEINDA